MKNDRMKEFQDKLDQNKLKTDRRLEELYNKQKKLDIAYSAIVLVCVLAAAVFIGLAFQKFLELGISG